MLTNYTQEASIPPQAKFTHIFMLYLLKFYVGVAPEMYTASSPCGLTLRCALKRQWRTVISKVNIKTALSEYVMFMEKTNNCKLKIMN